MAKHHKQLSHEQRVVVYLLWQNGYTRSAIAKDVGVSRSTVNRELSCLEPLDKNRSYFSLAREADNRSIERKSRNRSQNRKISSEIWDVVEEKLSQ